MLKKLSGSVLTKLIAIYILMAVLLIGVLGFTLANACKQELLNIRIQQLAERVESVAQMLRLDNDLEALEQPLFISVLQGVVDEYDAVLQVALPDGSIYCEIDGQSIGVIGQPGAALDNNVMRVINQGKTYAIVNYPNKTYNKVMSTVAMPVYSGPDRQEILCIVAMHASDAAVDVAYGRLISKFWIPCLAIVGLCVVLVMLLNYSITTPLVEMNSAANEIKRGNFDKRVYVTSEDEVGQLAESFNAMAEELSKTDTMRKDFVANISHELRTPLTSINGFVQGILDGTIPEQEQRKYLEIVLAETQRLSRLTREMLDLSRIESGKYEVNKVSFDINELLRRVIITMETKLDEKDIDFAADFREERINVLADMGCIEQVCVNLLDNAIKFTDKGKNITVVSEIVDGKAKISISDQGKGISEQDAAHIWDRFYTENKSRAGNIGMGLGLSIVKRLLMEHGQDITVESKLGEGTCFAFTLDLAPKGWFAKSK